MYRASIWLSLCTLLPVSVSAQAASPQSTAAPAAVSQAVPSKDLSSQPVTSQDKEIEEQKETIRQLVTEMKELKARLAALEAKQPSAVISSTTEPPAATTEAARKGEIAGAQVELLFVRQK